MTKRVIARKVFVIIGAVELLLFVVSGLNNSTAGGVGGFFLFVGGTNFFVQCPLLSAVTRMFKRKQWNRIHTQKM